MENKITREKQIDSKERRTKTQEQENKIHQVTISIRIPITFSRHPMMKRNTLQPPITRVKSARIDELGMTTRKPEAKATAIPKIEM